jgi:hypothetical protein
MLFYFISPSRHDRPAHFTQLQTGLSLLIKSVIKSKKAGDSTPFMPSCFDYRGHQHSERGIMNGSADFAAVFEGLARTEQAEETVVLGGVNVRMVRVVGGLEGRWDSHGHSVETVVVWSGARSPERCRMAAVRW